MLRLADEVLELVDDLAALEGAQLAPLGRGEPPRGGDVGVVVALGVGADLAADDRLGLERGHEHLAHDAEHVHAVRERLVLLHVLAHLLQQLQDFARHPHPDAVLPDLRVFVPVARPPQVRLRPVHHPREVARLLLLLRGLAVVRRRWRWRWYWSWHWCSRRRRTVAIGLVGCAGWNIESRADMGNRHSMLT